MPEGKGTLTEVSSLFVWYNWSGWIYFPSFVSYPSERHMQFVAGTDSNGKDITLIQ